MNKEELDQLIESLWFDCHMKTIKNCATHWNIDFKGKDKNLSYPPMTIIPDTQDAVVAAIKKAKLKK